MTEPIDLHRAVSLLRDLALVPTECDAEIGFLQRLQMIENADVRAPRLSGGVASDRAVVVACWLLWGYPGKWGKYNQAMSGGADWGVAQHLRAIRDASGAVSRLMLDDVAQILFVARARG